MSSAAYVTVRVGGEIYATTAGSVKELVMLQTLTRVPAMPPCILGLMNLRGTVLPVIDLARQLGLGETTLTVQTCVMVVGGTDKNDVKSLLGVISDDVLDVVTLDTEAIDPAPSFGSRINSEYLTGITRIDGQYVLLLDLGRVLSADELLAVAEASAS